MAADRYGPYIVGTSVSLSRKDIEKLLAAFGSPTRPTADVLGGRAKADFLSLDSVGTVVVKSYRRGGLIRALITDRYLKAGRPRSQKEFRMLQMLHRRGISVPEAVAWSARGGLFYRCWLVTKAIPSAVTLAQLSRSDPVKAVQCTHRASEQIRRLIRHRILHVDLHPGNVLVDAADAVMLIDFDRARRYRFGASALAGRYRSRWRRAVVKHELPNFLVAEMEAALGDASKVG